MAMAILAIINKSFFERTFRTLLEIVWEPTTNLPLGLLIIMDGSLEGKPVPVANGDFVYVGESLKCYQPLPRDPRLFQDLYNVCSYAHRYL